MTAVRVMVPIKITPSMLLAGTTVPEPNTANGEVAWVSAGTYTAGDLRTSAGSVWLCRLDHTGRTALPAGDGVYWLRYGPTDRMAAFDDYTSTKATGTGSLTYVIQPGFYGAVRVYGLKGDSCTITVRDAPGGAVVATQTFGLFAQAAGLYELLFTALPGVDQVGLDDLPILPVSELTVTVNAAGAGGVAIGDIKVGDWRQLIGDSKFGGMEYGARSERKTYTYREYAKDGTYTTIQRSASRDVSCSVKLEGDSALYADAVLGEIIDIAVPFEASSLPRYGYLNTLGFVSGSISPDSYGVASLNLNIKGNI